MAERPIKDLIDALRQCGGQIDYLANEGYPPLKINGSGLQGGRVSIKRNISSQFLTAMLMAAPLAADTLEIVVDGELVSKPYIRITLDVMAKFGVNVENDNFQLHSPVPSRHQLHLPPKSRKLTMHLLQP